MRYIPAWLGALSWILALALAVFGFTQAGWAGALTGFTAGKGIMGGVAAAASSPSPRFAGVAGLQSALWTSGGLSALGCVIGVYLGGWETGFLWGTVGFFAGILLPLLAVVRHAKRRPRPAEPTP